MEPIRTTLLTHNRGSRHSVRPKKVQTTECGKMYQQAQPHNEANLKLQGAIIKDQLKEKTSETDDSIGLLENLTKIYLKNFNTSFDNTKSEHERETEKFISYAESLRKVYPNHSEPPEDIIGLEHIITAIQKALLSSQISNVAINSNLKDKGILLFGPPGTAKTTILKEAAKAASCLTGIKISVYKIAISDIVSKYVGETEKIIKYLFKHAVENAPSVILLDEVESLMKGRSKDDSDHSGRLKSTLLSEMDGFNEVQGLVVIGTTNHPELLDEAFRRRFHLRFLVGLPDQKGLQDIFKKYLIMAEESHVVDWKSINLVKLSDKTLGFTGDDIKSIVRRVAGCSYTLEFTKKTKESKLAYTNKEVIAKLKPIDMNALMAIIRSHRKTCNSANISAIYRWDQEFGTKICPTLNQNCEYKRSDSWFTYGRKMLAGIIVCGCCNGC